ncbi:SRPBCC family protein [Streptomyces sp. NPDC007088]|uniref:SRPBCC family protein n=1 Tax=Streptomyces sp. NPDC007088 TaxID=3364773 RepID=UPI0036C7B48A
MESETFTYTSYLRTSPEALWQALTDPAETSVYWGAELITEGEAGAPVVWQERGVRISHPEQTVLTAEPGRAFAYTWHTFTPEWAAAVGVDEATRAALAAEPRSRVRWTIEPLYGQVRLRLAHENLAPGGLLRPMIAEGWPVILSSLKTLLETGEPLPEPG